jgi:hypothetical protein
LAAASALAWSGPITARKPAAVAGASSAEVRSK